MLPDAPAELRAHRTRRLRRRRSAQVALRAARGGLRAGARPGAARCVRVPSAVLRFDGDAEDPPTNFHEWGPQNSRGFRALKVWTTIRQVGRQGYVKMIGDDIELAREMHRLAGGAEELEALTQSLSITTFRYVPADLDPNAPSARRTI